MAPTEVSETSFSSEEEEFEKLAPTLPQEAGWASTLCKYKGFWFPSKYVANAVFSFNRHFQALDSDIILASAPKSGTTWMKALGFAIVNRTRHSLEDSPLNSSNPHDIVPSIEFELYMKKPNPNLADLPHPRMFGTHMPYEFMPPSVLQSNCRIVYVARNPLDQLISFWKFCLKIRREEGEPPSLEEGFEKYCRGIHSFGPLADNVLGYWKASLERPDKVSFFKYEDMKADIVSHTKRLAEFIGFPFSEEEEKRGVVEEVCKLCSFENLRDLEANKAGKSKGGVEKSAYFREGKVRGWEEYLTPSQGEYLENLVEEKLKPHGLSLKVCRDVEKKKEQGS